jgi:uncharacterized protein (DUF2344 family)
LLNIEEVPLNAPSATKVLEQAEYYLCLGLEDGEHQHPDWTAWIDALLETETLLWEKPQNRGNLKLLI